MVCLWEISKDGAATYYYTEDIHNRTWEEAREMCQLEGGDLATLSSRFLVNKLLTGLKILRKVRPEAWVAGLEYGNTIDGYCMKIFKNFTLNELDNCATYAHLVDDWQDRYIQAICERRIEEVPCTSHSDCDGNATCSLNQVTNHKFIPIGNMTSKTCTCNFGYYGNGTVCVKVD